MGVPDAAPPTPSAIGGSDLKPQFWTTAAMPRTASERVEQIGLVARPQMRTTRCRKDCNDGRRNVMREGHVCIAYTTT